MKTQKTWFITGASRGFGLDITKAALAAGDRVVATVRSKANELVNELGNSPLLYVVTMDITDEKQIEDAVQQSLDHFGHIDVLVNNAGNGLLSAVEEASAAEVRQSYEVNVFGTLNVIRAILPAMRERKSGHIVNISSVGGIKAYEGWGVYGSAKFAIEGLTEALAIELAPLGIFATVVAPGFFRTDFLDESSLVKSARVIEDYKDTVGLVRDFAIQANRKQPGDPKKLAKAFVQLGHSEKPPVHLLLGNDTLNRYKEKLVAFEEDINAWLDITTGTDHADVSGVA